MCVPTLPVRRGSYRLLCCLTFLQYKIYHCRSVEILQRSMLEVCVFWQRVSWQYRPSALVKKTCNVPANMGDIHSLSWCLSVQKNKGRVPVWGTSLTVADRKQTPLQDINTSRASAPCRWKRSRTQTHSRDPSSPSRCSSLLRALCFRLTPLFLKWEKCFC